jgi:hypothetical protein
LTVQIRLIGPAHEVDRIVAAVEREVHLDHANADREASEAGRTTLSIVAENHAPRANS